MTSSFVVVKSTSVVVELLFASQDFLSHSSLTLELVRLLVGSSFAALDGSEHSYCYSMRSWVVLPPWIVGVGVWVVIGKITILSHIVCLLLICR